MLKSVRGLYRNGWISLSELPAEVCECDVIVTFLDGPLPKKEGRMMQFGILKGLIKTTDEDFDDPQFTGERTLDKWDKANRTE